MSDTTAHDYVLEKLDLHEHLAKVKYPLKDPYIPDKFALMMLNFMKLVHEHNPTENKTPVMHLKMLDKFVGKSPYTLNCMFRGAAKSTLERYLILYLGVFGSFPDEPEIDYGLYVADSMENNVKKMRLNIEVLYNSSPFLKETIPTVKITDARWYFKNADGKELVITGHGALTGVRGTTELSKRPQLALLDDLMSDEAAASPTQIAKIKDTIYNAVIPALHPKYHRVIWNGTPFNMADPLTEAIASGGWDVNVFPVCEEFPCKRENFKGAWSDRFDYDAVLRIYNLLKQNGKIAAFYQEYMLQVVSTEDRVVNLDLINWYSRNELLANKDHFNFYVTSDFATTDEAANDPSGQMVWAFNSAGQWFLVDGYNIRQEMDKNIDDMFTYVQLYSPIEVGVEISGQQRGFIPWLKQLMITRGIFFSLARDEGSKKEGLSPKNRNKLTRFQVVAPWFNAGVMNFPEELKGTPFMDEVLHQLGLVTYSGIKSKHDECIDCISQLGALRPWKPAVPTTESQAELYDDMMQDDMDSYIV